MNAIFRKNSDIVLIVCDITNRKSFEELTSNVVKESNKNKEIRFGIIGNKKDLFKYKEVNNKEGEEFAKDNNALFFETRAVDYESVEYFFKQHVNFI